MGVRKGKRIREEFQAKEQCAWAMNEGLTCGKNREPLPGSRREIGSGSERKAGQAGESHTTKGPTALVPPSLASPPSRSCCVVAYGSILPKILRRERDWGESLTMPFKKLFYTQCQGPAHGWEVTLSFSVDLGSFCACHRT